MKINRRLVQKRARIRDRFHDNKATSTIAPKLGVSHIDQRDNPTFIFIASQLLLLYLFGETYLP